MGSGRSGPQKGWASGAPPWDGAPSMGSVLLSVCCSGAWAGDFPASIVTAVIPWCTATTP